MELTAPSVQAILTADTLIQHYVRAVEAVRRSLGHDEIEMAAQVGDANRTYPSIWEQLDHARAVLAAEGRDTATFDRLRAAAGNTAVGVDSHRTEITEGYNLFSGTGYHGQTLTMHFNLRGVELAHAASAALKQAMPDVDWDALRREQSAPPPDLTGGSRRVWGVVALLVAVAAVVAIRLFLKQL